MNPFLEPPKSYYLYVECVPYYTAFRYTNGKTIEVAFLKIDVFYKGRQWMDHTDQFIFMN
jgi:hypothetical protein